MEIQVCTTRGVLETTRIRAPGSCCGAKNCSEDIDEDRTYGISVKIRPVRRSCSQPPRIRHNLHDVIMEEPNLEKLEAGEFENEEPDSTLINNQTLKSEDSTSISINVTSQGSDHTCGDCSTFSSVSQHKGDLFDQLVSHFNKKNSISCFEERGRPARRPQIRSGTIRTTRRRTVSDQHTIASKTQSCSRSSYLTLPEFRRKQAEGTICQRQTSTPETSNLEQSSNSSLGVSRIRALSTSSSDNPNNDGQSSRLSSNSNSTTLRPELNRTGKTCRAALLNQTIVREKSFSCQTLDNIKLKQRSSPLDMLRSHARRSMTPDITSQRQSRRTDPNSSTLNGLLSRGSLDRLTADSIDRRRVRRRTSDKFNDTIQSAGQLASLPQRSRSALGHVTRDSDNSSTSSLHGGEAPPNPNSSPSAKEYYKDKNGRLRGSHDAPNPLPRARAPPPDVTINSIDSESEENPTPCEPSMSDDVQSTHSLDVKEEFSYDVHALSQTPLDVALHEDHDSIMRLSRIREDQFTVKLISAMKELKDIAEVARIIDEVDDEEWLLVFIGELDHRLRYLMKLEEEKDEGPEDQEANIREKATILDVALDLISFLKDRSAYRMHSRSTYYTNIDGTPDDEGDVYKDDSNATIQRMRKLAASKPHNPYEMQKWQRQLSNLAGTLDKYIHVLQKTKEIPVPPPHHDATTSTDPEEDVNAREYMDALSEFSTMSSGDSRLENVDQLTSSGVSVDSPEPNKVEYKPSANSNYNNNNNNNNNLRHPPSQQSRTLPVLDLRYTRGSNHILSHIGQAAQVQGSKDDVFSHTCIDGHVGQGFMEPPYSQNQDPRQHHGNKNTRFQPTSPGGTVVSAYCRLPDARRRSASVSNDRDIRKAKNRQKTEFRMSVESLTRRETTTTVSLGRRTRSVDNRQNSTFPAPHQRISSSGARPKVRPATQSSSRRSATHSESSSNSDLDRPQLRHRLVTSSASTQCDLDQGSRQREKNAEEKLKQMKRRADLLKTGLEETRQERDEKERKIAVLQARLDRMKKNLVVGESEKGAVEEEMDRLNKLLQEKTVESAEEIAALQKRFDELERKLKKEREKYGRMSETVQNLQQQLMAAQKQYEQMAGGKRELEQRIHDLTISLMHERQHGAQLHDDNSRLERELVNVNRRMEENAAENELARQQLQQLSCDLEKKLTDERQLADTAAGEKVKASERENVLLEAENRIAGLERENEKLNEEKRELVEALSHEQMMSKDLAKCYMEQVEYLNHELKINEEMKKVQQEQYDQEISRLLSEGAIQSGLNFTQLSKARDEVQLEKKRADELEKENEQLKIERDDAQSSQVAKKSEGTSTEDKAVQAEDMSYTRMRAFDWYSSQAHRDALRLTEQGRQLEMETRERIRVARDAMRQVNHLLMRERSSTLPMIHSNRFGYQQRR